MIESIVFLLVWVPQPDYPTAKFIKSFPVMYDCEKVKKATLKENPTLNLSCMQVVAVNPNTRYKI